MYRGFGFQQIRFFFNYNREQFQSAQRVKLFYDFLFVAVLNQKCYGKFYDPASYYIECQGNNELPTRLIELNGADFVVGTNSGSYNYPTDTAAAKTLFDKMQATSATKKAEYFNN